MTDPHPHDDNPARGAVVAVLGFFSFCGFARGLLLGWAIWSGH